MVNTDKISRALATPLNNHRRFEVLKGLQISKGMAYQIQQAAHHIRTELGFKHIGYKVGCSSELLQSKLGIDEPVLGFLYDDMRWGSGATFSLEAQSNLAVEGELAVVFNQSIDSVHVDMSRILQSIDSVFPVVELHTLPDDMQHLDAGTLIASNGMHAGFVEPVVLPEGGARIQETDLHIAIGTSVSTQVRADELAISLEDALVWLVNQLKQTEFCLDAGDCVLCGSVADLYAIDEPCAIEVRYGDLTMVSCTIC